MNEKKFAIAIAITSLVILSGGVVLALRLGKTAVVEANPGAQVGTSATAYDWGTIKIDAGNVETTFDLKNTGVQPLKLSNVSTSCMCTTAQLILGTTQSPSFGMHAKSSYILEVPPQETAKLKVVFDPAYHGPSGVGPITRQVTLQTNDPQKPELSFMLTAMVTR